MLSCSGSGGGGAPNTNNNKVKVVVRLRPFIEREKAVGAKTNWAVEPTEIIHIDPETSLPKLHNNQQFVFDNVYGADVCTKEVYEEVVAPIVAEAFNGFNGAVLCYGQTSSGKTHTLYGTEKDPGIISFLAEDIQKRIEVAPAGSILIRLNLIEIYNESVKDLLCSENPIEIIEKDGAVVPAKAEHIDILSGEDIMRAAMRLQRERRLGETRMNKQSSRSHTILRMTINTFEDENETPFEEYEEVPAKRIISAVLNFVDLAGSEKASQTGASGDRLREAGHINTSLSALSKVVNQLSKQWEKANRRESSSLMSSMLNSTDPRNVKSRMPANCHISYRDSKLTRLLQSSLAGDALIVIICNATPASSEETLSTLRFALSAKEIQTKPKRNLIIDRIDKLQYEKTIKELQAELLGKDEELKLLRKALSEKNGPSDIDRRSEWFSTSIQWPAKSPEKIVPSPLSTPKSTLRLRHALLSNDLCEARNDWEEEKELLKCEMEILKSEKLELLKKFGPLNTMKNNCSTPVSTLRMQRALLSSSYEEALKSWEEERELLKAEKDFFRIEKEELGEKLEAALNETKELRANLEEEKSKLSAKLNEELESNLIEVQKCNEMSLQAELKAKVLEQKLRDTLVILEQQRNWEKDNERLKAENEFLRLQNIEELSNNDAKTKKLEEEKELLKAENDTFRDENKELGEKLEAFLDGTKELRAYLEEEKSKLSQLSAKQNEELESNRIELQKCNEISLQAELKANVLEQKLQNTLMLLEQRNNVEQDYERLKVENEFLRSQNIEELSNNDAKTKKSEEEMELLKTEKDFFRIENEELGKKLEVALNETKELRACLEEKSKLSDKHKEELESNRIELQKCNEISLQAELKANVLEQKLQNTLMLLEQRNIMEKDYERLKVENEFLRSQNIEGLSNNEMKTKKSEEEKELLKAENDTFRDENKKLCEKLEASLNETKELRAFLEEKCKLSDKHKEELESNRLELQKCNDISLQAELKANVLEQKLQNTLMLLEQRNNVEQDYERLKVENEFLRSQNIEELSNNDAKTRKLEEEKERLKADNDALRVENKKLGEKLEASCKETKELRAYLEEEKCKLSAIHNEELENKELCEKLVTSDNSIKVLRARLEKQEKSLKNLEEERELHKAQIDVFLGEKKDLGEKLEASLNETKELRAHLEEKEKALNARKPPKVNHGQQTPGEWDFTRMLQEMKVRAKIAHRDFSLKLEQANKKNSEMMVERKRLEKKIEEQTTQAQEWEGCARKLKETIDNNKSNQVETGVQCQYIVELLERAKNGENVKLPPEYPNIGILKSEINNYRNKVFLLEKAFSSCQCAENSTRKRHLLAYTIDPSDPDLKQNQQNSTDPSNQPPKKKMMLPARMGSAMDRKGSSLYSLRSTTRSVFPKASQPQSPPNTQQQQQSQAQQQQSQPHQMLLRPRNQPSIIPTDAEFEAQRNDFLKWLTEANKD